MSGPDNVKRSDDPGVPEALPRTLVRLRDRLGVETLDRLWIFPPQRNGRRERGLVVATLVVDDEDRREVITAAYLAEHTGRGVTVEPTLTREGWATPDRCPPVMSGVARRGGEEGGDAEEVEIGGSAERFEALLERYDEHFLQATPS